MAFHLPLQRQKNIILPLWDLSAQTLPQEAFSDCYLLSEATRCSWPSSRLWRLFLVWHNPLPSPPRMHTFINPSLFLSLRLCLSRSWILQLGPEKVGVVLQVQSGQAELHINHQVLYVSKVQRLTEMRSGKVPRMEEMMLSQRPGLSHISPTTSLQGAGLLCQLLPIQRPASYPDPNSCYPGSGRPVHWAGADREPPSQRTLGKGSDHPSPSSVRPRHFSVGILWPPPHWNINSMRTTRVGSAVPCWHIIYAPWLSYRWRNRVCFLPKLHKACMHLSLQFMELGWFGSVSSSNVSSLMLWPSYNFLEPPAVFCKSPCFS